MNIVGVADSKKQANNMTTDLDNQKIENESVHKSDESITDKPNNPSDTLNSNVISKETEVS